ncbi:hypothetical protein EDC32_1011238 [Laceyella sacchari]|uniref:DUF2332 domain-containing protein n=1 Tax=Laceyella sacchari TaxID=37482 RepID=UPI00104B173E|nr:DUF2332 domain-containing protein [Laceyella sacchari]TCW41572.1 hypothetical protein EDC32_1011238 [Laceyella sacchari]
MRRGNLSAIFLNFANRECRGSSDLYEHLALRTAEDGELLDLASHARPGQPVPNLFLGAVHFLLLQGKEHPLAQYYPSVVAEPKDPSQAFAHFRDFCFTFKDEIITILKEKRVQTNEVRRCAYLYPSFCMIHHLTEKPLSLIEIGASAGLQLLWDKYAYSYGDVQTYGDASSPVLISTEIRGENRPFLLPTSPPVATRCGVDLHVSELTDSENVLWMRALIWPEHTDRVQLFEKAAEHFLNESVELIEGDGVALLPELASKIPEETVICIFHTHVANQLSESDKQKLIHHVTALAESREVFHLYNNLQDRYLHLDRFIDGEWRTVMIAETDGHARWVRWM